MPRLSHRLAVGGFFVPGIGGPRPHRIRQSRKRVVDPAVMRTNRTLAAPQTLRTTGITRGDWGALPWLYGYYLGAKSRSEAPDGHARWGNWKDPTAPANLKAASNPENP